MVLFDVPELGSAVNLLPDRENPATWDLVWNSVTVCSPELILSVLSEVQVLVPSREALPDNVEVPPVALIINGSAVHVTFHSPQLSEDSFFCW